MEMKILESVVLALLALLYITYYHALMKGGKVAKLLLILEVGLRIIGLVYLIVSKSFINDKELLSYIPVLMSICLYASKGVMARVLFYIMVLFIIMLLGFNLYSVYIQTYY